jgi:tRNA threonylcarbamoyladenosine biosynthesis protein TsaE
MTKSIFTSYSSLNNLPEIAKELLNFAGKTKVWLFLGDLGAGKTTLIKALCAQLGLLEVVTSPTFALVHEYRLPSNEAIYHIDAYRTDPETTVVEWQSYFDTGSYCFIEWPTRLGAVVLPSHIVISLAPQSAGNCYVQAQLKGRLR